jgi:hypothetical protein
VIHTAATGELDYRGGAGCRLAGTVGPGVPCAEIGERSAIAVVNFVASSPSGVLGQQLTSSATSSVTQWLLPYFFGFVFVEVFS